MVDSINPVPPKLLTASLLSIRRRIVNFLAGQPFKPLCAFFSDVSSKNLDANERGYALIGKPEDMHTWFFLYDETLRNPPESVGGAMDNDHAHNNYNVNYTTIGRDGGHGGYPTKKADMSASISVPNLDHREATPPNYNYYSQQQQQQQAPPQQQPHQQHQPAWMTHQQQQQHNFMMYGHSQSVHQHPTPPTPPMMERSAHGGRVHHHAHGTHCGLNQHHSRSVPSVAAAVAQAASVPGNGRGGNNGSMEPYASRNSLNHEMSSSRPQSRNHSHYCQQQGCDYPSG